MNQFPQGDLRQYEAEAQLKIREQERKRDINLAQEDAYNTSLSNRLSRRAFVLIQLTILVFIIVGIVIAFRFLH